MSDTQKTNEQNCFEEMSFKEGKTRLLGGGRISLSHFKRPTGTAIDYSDIQLITKQSTPNLRACPLQIKDKQELKEKFGMNDIKVNPDQNMAELEQMVSSISMSPTISGRGIHDSSLFLTKKKFADTENDANLENVNNIGNNEIDTKFAPSCSTDAKSLKKKIPLKKTSQKKILQSSSKKSANKKSTLYSLIRSPVASYISNRSLQANLLPSSSIVKEVKTHSCQLFNNDNTQQRPVASKHAKNSKLL